MWFLHPLSLQGVTWPTCYKFFMAIKGFFMSHKLHVCVFKFHGKFMALRKMMMKLITKWKGDLDKVSNQFSGRAWVQLPLGNSAIFIFWVIWLENALSFIHFTQVTISLNIMYSHLSFRHTEPCKYGRTCVTHKNLVYNLARHELSIAQWLEHLIAILELHRFDSCWWTQKFMCQSNWLKNASSFISLSKLSHFIISWRAEFFLRWSYYWLSKKPAPPPLEAQG